MSEPHPASESIIRRDGIAAPVTLLALRNELEAALKPVRLLDHPFYAAWSAGELSREDLRFYAGQYYHVVRAFPNLLASTLRNLEKPEHRRSIVRNLADEEGLEGVSHPDLWLRFGQGLGARPHEVAAAPALPETKEAIATLERLAASDPATAMAALWAVESQAPEVSAEKLRGLKAFYRVEDASSTAYFRVHAELDVEHSDEELAILEDLAADPASAGRAVDGAVAAAAALRRVLDGVHRVRCAS